MGFNHADDVADEFDEDALWLRAYKFAWWIGHCALTAVARFLNPPRDSTDAWQRHGAGYAVITYLEYPH